MTSTSYPCSGRLRKNRESRFLTAKAIRNDRKYRALAALVNSCPFQIRSKPELFPQPPRQTWRPAFAIAAAIYPAGRCSNTPGGAPRANLSNCNERNRCHACQLRRAGLGVRVNADHLACLRRLQSQPSCQHVDSLRITQRGFFEPKRSIHFDQAIALCSQRLDLVSVLDGLEVLPGKCHNQQKQTAERKGELFHLAAAVWIFNFHQARIVDRLGKINFWSSRPARLPPDHRCCALCRYHLCHPGKTGIGLRQFLLCYGIPVGQPVFAFTLVRARFGSFDHGSQLINYCSCVHVPTSATFPLLRDGIERR